MASRWGLGGTHSLLALLVSATALVAGNSSAGPMVSAPMGVATEGPTAVEILQRQMELNRWLLGELPARTIETALRVRVARAEIAAVEQARSVPMKVGLVRVLEPKIQVQGLGRGSEDPPQGGIRRLDDGGLVWALAVMSADAGAIRLQIQNMALPEGAVLYVYNRGGEAFGPYAGAGPHGSGEFWTTAVFGSEAVLQLRVDGGVPDAVLRKLSFSVTAVGLILSRFAGAFGAAPPPPGFCGNPSCIVDASCFNGTPAEPAKNAVAKMEWVQGAFIYTCSGGLIADNDPSQGNYFLTANHCISKNNNARNTTFYFRFATSTCNGSCPSNNGWPYRNTGSTVKKTGRKGDYTLLQLSSNPPVGSVFLGWTSAPVANSDGLPLYRISNPNFGPQVYSEHEVDTGAPTCSSWPRGERIYSRDTTGAIDGGSSGSPVLNGSSQIVGQLSGTCGFNVNDPCDPISNATVDGAFAYYFSSVRPFLDP
jgi:V8-like Glu-specific endopeptidase